MRRSTRRLMLRSQTLRRLTPVRLDELALVVGGGSKKHGNGNNSEADSTACEDTLSNTSKYC